MARADLTVVLPCAGEGLRLGLTEPKPLFELRPGLRLIDLTLLHLQMAVQKSLTFEVVVVVKPKTSAVFDYVSRCLPGVSVRRCPFDSQYSEWPGSVYSASAFFGQYNVVLLPDSLLTLSPESSLIHRNGECLLETVRTGLEKRPVYFLVVAETSPRLSQLGAVRVEQGQVLNLSDKPAGDLSAFNAFWAVYGFRQARGRALYRYLKAAVAHQPAPFPLSELGPPGDDFIDSYQDLGTWEAIENFRMRYPDKTCFLRDHTS